jgi:integrase
VNLEKPMSRASYKRSFDTAQEKAGVKCRFYDARHSFVTRLAENPAVSVETIRQLAGHVSEKMLSRYAHIRVQARRTAIATLEPSPAETALHAEIAAEGAQKWAQFGDGPKPLLN